MVSTFGERSIVRTQIVNTNKNVKFERKINYNKDVPSMYFSIFLEIEIYKRNDFFLKFYKLEMIIYSL